MKHVLSIIIPLYNSEKYINRCIDSILELQISKEIIVIDDGSIDNSYQVVKPYADNGLIRLYQQENKGVSEARNLGLSVCSGDIIAFVDSDDYIITQGFDDLYNQFKLSNAEIAIGGVFYNALNENAWRWQPYAKLQNTELNGQECFATLMRTNTFTPLVFCYLFKKDFIDKYNLRFCHRMSEDDLWTSIAMCNATKVYVSDVLHYSYYKHSDSITGKNPNTLFRAENHIAVANDLYKYLKTHKLRHNAEEWLCCKILYIVSIAVKIYAEKGKWDFKLDLQMYQDLFKRLLSSSDEYVKKIGLMFGGRIIKTIKLQI